MHSLKVSVSFPGASHSAMELRLFASDADGEVVIALPMLAACAPPVSQVAIGADTAAAPADDYVLGGYAGI